MVLIQIINSGLQRSSHLDIPIKYQCLIGITILIPMGRFFDTIIHLYTCPTLMYTSKPAMLPMPWLSSGMNKPPVYTQCWGLYLRVFFSKPNIMKLDKVISKLTQELCNIHRNTTNILTHLYNKDSGTNVTSLLLDYVPDIDKQLTTILDDLGWLRTTQMVLVSSS